MSEILTAVAAIIAAIGAIVATVVGFLNRRAMTEARERASVAAAAALTAKEAAESSKAEIIATRDGVFEVGKQIDGRLSELLQLTKDSAFAEGRLSVQNERREAT